MIELKHIERFYPLAQGQFFCVLRDVNLKIEEGDSAVGAPGHGVTKRRSKPFHPAARCETSGMADVTIETIKNGPYIVTGEVELKDADGNTYPVEKRMALCR